MAIGITNSGGVDTKKYLFRVGASDVPWVTYTPTGTPTYITSAIAKAIKSAEAISEGVYVTDSALDLTPYSKLWVAWQGFYAGIPSGVSSVNVSTTKNGDYTVYDARTLRSAIFTDYPDSGIGYNGAKLDSIDISALNGNYYIRLHSREGDDDAGDSVFTYAYAIWLEV